MMTPRQNPWPGLASYDEKNGMFCGRSAAVNDLFSLICNNPVVTLYGRSGIGKTSLVKAGVAPLLRRRGYLPVYVRLMQEVRSGAEGIFAKSITDKLLEAVPQMRQDVPVEVPASHPEFLWEWFLAHPLMDADGKAVTPVVILDQFEEVFFYREEEVRLLLRQISLLLDDSRRLPESCDPEDFRARFRLVFSFRDDALYKMEEAADRDNLSALKQNRYILKALQRDQAREVILLPSEDLQTGRRFVSPEVADHILDKLSGGEDDSVDPAILSLLMSELYEKMDAAAATEITEEFVSEFGGDIIRNYYLKGVSRIRPGALSFLERELVTADGRRRSVASGDIQGSVRQEDLDKLLGSHILSAVVKGEVIDYELSHDVLCPIVRQNRRRRWVRRKVARISAFAVAFCALVAGVLLGWNVHDKNVRNREAKAVADSLRLNTAVMTNQELRDSIINQARRREVERAFKYFKNGRWEKFMECYQKNDTLRMELEEQLFKMDYFDKTGYTRDVRISEDGRYLYYQKDAEKSIILDLLNASNSINESKFKTGLRIKEYDADKDTLKRWVSIFAINTLSYNYHEEGNRGRNMHVDISVKSKSSNSVSMTICTEFKGKDHKGTTPEDISRKLKRWMKEAASSPREDL